WTVRTEELVGDRATPERHLVPEPVEPPPQLVLPTPHRSDGRGPVDVVLAEDGEQLVVEASDTGDVDRGAHELSDLCTIDRAELEPEALDRADPAGPHQLARELDALVAPPPVIRETAGQELSEGWHID